MDITLIYIIGILLTLVLGFIFIYSAIKDSKKQPAIYLKPEASMQYQYTETDLSFSKFIQNITSQLDSSLKRFAFLCVIFGSICFIFATGLWFIEVFPFSFWVNVCSLIIIGIGLLFSFGYDRIIHPIVKWVQEGSIN